MLDSSSHVVPGIGTDAGVARASLGEVNGGKANWRADGIAVAARSGLIASLHMISDIMDFIIFPQFASALSALDSATSTITSSAPGSTGSNYLSSARFLITALIVTFRQLATRRTKNLTAVEVISSAGLRECTSVLSDRL